MPRSLLPRLLSFDVFGTLINVREGFTLKAGQTFYEGPNDVHVVGRNASNTEPARFVVVLLKSKGAPLQTPVKE